MTSFTSHFANQIVKFENVTEDMLNDFNTLKRINDTDYNKIMEIWLSNKGYDHFSYLMSKFIKGELICNFMYAGSIDDDHSDSISTLIELNNHNIVTLQGHRSCLNSRINYENKEVIIWKQRSYLEFIMKVTSEFNIIEFGQTLYNKDMEVFMVTFDTNNNSNDIKNYVFSDNLNIHGITSFDRVKNIIKRNKHKRDEHWAVTNTSVNWKKFKAETWCCGDQMLDSCQKNLDIIENFEKGHYCSIIIFSKYWNDNQCDEVLLSIL